MEDKKPTRLIKPPERANRYAWHYTCDNGKIYTMRELAGIFGLSSNTIICRIRRYGWNYPLLFGPKCKKYRGPLKKSEAGYAVWSLANKPRHANLAKIPAMGVLERKYLHVSRESERCAG